jgi:hypothetical protein
LKTVQLTIASPRRLAEFTNKPIMGYRETVKIHKEEKEVTKKGKDGKEHKGECSRAY